MWLGVQPVTIEAEGEGGQSETTRFSLLKRGVSPPVVLPRPTKPVRQSNDEVREELAPVSLPSPAHLRLLSPARRAAHSLLTLCGTCDARPEVALHLVRVLGLVERPLENAVMQWDATPCMEHLAHLSS